jgi:ubiquinol-cytochrome c reductase cytochrome b subunit
MPFVIFGVVFLHVAALHITGSNNPLGIDPKGPQDTLPFHPYYTAKDSVGIVVYLIVFAALVFFAPNILGHPDNYTPANPLVTPPHIVPEWYFLPFYAILRAITFDIFWIIPAKLGGVLAMFGAIAVLFALPWLDTSPVRSGKFRPIFKWFYYGLMIDFIVLGYVGSQPPEGWLPTIGLVATAYYFAYFLVVLPVLSRIERPLPLPESIDKPVLARGAGGGFAPQPAE